MNLIKLDAIDSTNDFLKVMAQDQNLENFTVITAKEQTKGRGQMGTVWNTESGKNLITSILVRDSIESIERIFNLNIVIALSIIQGLQKQKINSLAVKWPNDIMTENKKIAGILIENGIKENGRIDSIIGIGLNVNQINFENLPKASSLKNITGLEYDIDSILEDIVFCMKENMEKLKNNDIAILCDEYDKLLFKKGKPVLFENAHQGKFMGIIQGVTPSGKLEVQLEDDRIESYNLKEITMLY